MFSWSAQGAVNPLPVVSAKGIYFFDAYGNRWTDMNSMLMCSNLGHQHPKVVEAIKQQADKLTFIAPSMTTEVRAEIGPLLSSHTPGDLNHFFFTLGGAEANENAIKLARFSSGRPKIMSRYRSYHGATHATAMVTGDFRRWPNERFPAMGGVIRFFDPYKYRSHLYEPGMSDESFSERCLQQLEEQILYENPESIAAVFIETVTGTNGLIPPPEGYLVGLRKLCDKYGILLICDEVMAGFGRTGEWFAVDNWQVVPDILTMAKGLTGAHLPLSAVALKPTIFEKFREVPFSGGLTYQAHPLCLAAAVACLKVLEEEDLVGNAKRVGKVMTELHLEMKEKHVCVGDVRSIGLFGVLELVKNRQTKEPLLATSQALIQANNYLKQNHIFVYFAAGGSLCHTNPPLCITEEQLRETFVHIDNALGIIDQNLE
eukprot:TRINITY_DN15781_c0_g1_i1.p1 TRINITY_DN15781_c0_g1~~TRINITY_DN15781_c0_g1_i1.p1  ORF type:complete len:430 (-),score=90.92 TRINITY_DN15781_c0_g1_i1:257-1546(-)